MALQQSDKAYIIAARRTALGRIGGLHGARRIEDLAAPVISAALADIGVAASEVDEIIVGNATAGGNPARLIALASGLPEAANATTIDQQDASGLVAIIQASRLITQGDADVVVAGGAESLSTAPWRIARPKNVHQMPRFIHPDPFSTAGLNLPFPLECTEKLARDLNISRARQDAFAASSLQRAVFVERHAAGKAEFRFVGGNLLAEALFPCADHDLGDRFTDFWNLQFDRHGILRR